MNEEETPATPDIEITPETPASVGFGGSGGVTGKPNFGHIITHMDDQEEKK